MAGVRVIARGAGVRTAATTGSAGDARAIMRPRRPGVITVRVEGSVRCVRRIGVAAELEPASLAG